MKALLRHSFTRIENVIALFSKVIQTNFHYKILRENRAYGEVERLRILSNNRCINSLPNDNILDSAKLKASAHDNLIM